MAILAIIKDISIKVNVLAIFYIVFVARTLTLRMLYNNFFINFRQE
ncbi:hypothetical protein HMPREF0216_00249 [Clostridium celatum DSM 1785]|uniref:Uncharacterized protein n=1 Tax=Clostridium celatum DSM 1785 TaxID=545697 RepID=L1QN36_9CLOT|nr:hypothetical protein HMPREF0216_00249 [Clostridium celatum DSM 1785]